MLRFSISIIIVLIFVMLFSCHSKKTDSSSLWGTWKIESATIDDRGIIPASDKVKMSDEIKGQMWRFNPDSTVMIKDPKDAEFSKAHRFHSSKSNGHTTVSLGGMVSNDVELSDIKDGKMDMTVTQGITITAHLVKQ